MSREMLWKLLEELNDEAACWRRAGYAAKRAEVDALRQEVRAALGLPAEGILAAMARDER
jgi:hypothetical protein